MYLLIWHTILYLSSDSKNKMMKIIIIGICFLVSNSSYAMQQTNNQHHSDEDLLKSLIDASCVINGYKTQDTIQTIDSILQTSSAYWRDCDKDRIARFMAFKATESLFNNQHIHTVQTVKRVYESYYCSVLESLRMNNERDISDMKQSFNAMKLKQQDRASCS